jgi:hypothetical protein
MPVLLFLAAIHFSEAEHLKGLRYVPAPKQARGKPRREDVRVAIAHVYRLLADAAPPGTLASAPGLRARFLDFAMDTLRFLQGTALGARTRPARCIHPSHAADGCAPAERRDWQLPNPHSRLYTACCQDAHVDAPHLHALKNPIT